MTQPATQARPLPGPVALVAHQFRYDLLAFSRNRQSRFFTLALPITYLLIFATVFRNRTVAVPGGRIDTSIYYVPGIIALGIISTALTNLVVSVTTQRESGILKRRRAAPVPAGVLIAGRALTAASVGVVMTAILLAIGWFAYSARVPARHVPALLLTVLAGALAFGCLGFALTSVIHDDDAAIPVTAAVTLPLYFISGVFLPTALLPHWLVQVAAVFPVRHFQLALLAAYNPHSAAAGLAGRDLAIMAAWGAAGLLVAARRFRWLPQSS